MVSWTEGEDDQLRELYEKYGNNYSRIAEVLGRARTSVRDRIVNTIAVENLRGPWTEEEDAKLVIGLIHHGTTWQEIVKDIPGRSENQARARAMGPHLRSLGYIMDELEAAKKRGALPEEHQRLAGVPWLRFKVAQGVAFCRAPAPGRPKKSSRRPHAVPGLDMGKIRRAYFKISKLSEFTRQRTQYILGYPAEFVRAGRLAEGGGAIELLGVLLGGGGGGGGGGGSAGEEVVEMDFEDELEEAAVRRVPRRWELGPGGEPVETVCLVGGCGAPALCSYEGEVKPLYCKAHQKEGMVDLFSEEYLATVLAEPPGGGGEDGDGDDGERGEAAAAGEVPDKTALAKKMNRWGQDARERNKGRGVAQGAWSEEEDALLRKVVEELTREREMKEGKEFQLGDLTQDQWSAAEALMVAGGVRRLRRQCRERWRDRLDPALARGAFSAQEDADLLHAWHHKKMMWAAMAAEPGLLPGRSESIIKQRGSCTTFKTYAARALAYVQSLRDKGELCAKAQALEGEAWEKHLCLRVAEFLRGEDEVEGIDVPLLRAVLGFQKAPADMRGKDSRWGPTYKRPQGPGAAARAPPTTAHARRRAAAARDLMAQGKVVGKGGVPLLAPRRCVLAACGELAEYGHEGEVKPIFCSAHKREGMVKVLGTAAAAKHPAKSEPKKKSKKMVTRLVEVTDDEAEDSGEEEEGGGEGGGGGGEEGPQQYCRREHCARTALFSQEGAAAPTHCKKHQEPGMVVNLGLRAFATAPLLGPGGGGGRGAAAKGKAKKGKKKTKMVEVVEEVTDEEDFSDGGPQRQPAKAEVPQPPPRAAVALFANDRWGSLDRPLACPRSDRPGPHCRPCRLKKGSCEFLNAWRKEMKQKMQNGEISEAAFVAQPKEKKKRRKRKAAAAKKAAPEEPEGPRDLCVVRDCEADAIFSFPGEKPIYCRKHKKKQMVQVAKAPRKKHKQHKKRKETLMDEVDESLFDDGIV